MTGRLVEALTAVAARAYPRSRRADSYVVRDCGGCVDEASGHAASPAGLGGAARICTTRAAAARRSASRSTASRPLVVRR